MKKFLLYLFFAYVALTVQALFFKNAKPDFILILVCFYSLRHGQLKGVAYGALTGLIIDIAGGFILGPHIISKSFAAFLIRSVREKIFQWNIIVSTLMIAILSIIDIFTVYACLEVFSDVSLLNMPWKIYVMGIVYTILASLVIYGFFKPEKANGLSI